MPRTVRLVPVAFTNESPVDETFPAKKTVPVADTLNLVDEFT